jgi:hypothetical protein
MLELGAQRCQLRGGTCVTAAGFQLIVKFGHESVQ